MILVDAVREVEPGNIHARPAHGSEGRLVIAGRSQCADNLGFSHRSIVDALTGVINKKLIPTLLKDIGVTSIHTPCYELDWKYKSLLSKRLKEWKFTCIDTNGFNSAQVTVGGVNTKEINPETLESKLVKNLYFCGEILDVTGDCGGFNLQWAWSSGFLVGNSI